MVEETGERERASAQVQAARHNSEQLDSCDESGADDDSPLIRLSGSGAWPVRFSKKLFVSDGDHQVADTSAGADGQLGALTAQIDSVLAVQCGQGDDISVSVGSISDAVVGTGQR